MKQVITLGVIVVVVIGSVFGLRSYDPPVKFYNRSGQIQKQMKIFLDTLQPSSATGFNIDISSAGFTQVVNVQCNPELNTTTPGAMPQVSVKSWTTTSVSTNFTQANTTVVSILGVNVVGLQSLQSFSGVRLHIAVYGY